VLTIACVLRSGGIYTPTWAEKLARQCKRYAPEHRFVCLSDQMFNAWFDVIPLIESWPSWWSKIELFRPCLFTGSVLYFDLDTLIAGDIQDICAYRGSFAALRDFYRPQGLGSGVMSWTPSDRTDLIYENYRSHPINLPGGDQSLIEQMMPDADRLQDLFPEQIVSYKVHHCGNFIPGAASVVCLHGRPKFEQMPIGDPVRAAWEAA
jgi:hypothetical protein